MSKPGEQLSQYPAEIVVIIVEQQDPLRFDTGPTKRMLAREQVVGCQDPGITSDRNGAGVPSTDAIGAPARAGRYQDVGESVAEGIIRRDLLAPADDHVAVAPVDLPGPVFDDPAPGGQAGQACLPENPPAKLAAGLGQHYGVTALAKRVGSFQTRRAGPDNQDAGVGFSRPDPLRMPAPAPLLAHGRVLRATDGRHGHVARDT